MELSFEFAYFFIILLAMGLKISYSCYRKGRWPNEGEAAIPPRQYIFVCLLFWAHEIILESSMDQINAPAFFLFLAPLSKISFYIFPYEQ